MLSHHLSSAVKDLQDLIDITELDISDIKEANSDSQFERISLKEERISSFESKKAMIDHEISKMMSQNPSKELGELLNEEQRKALDDLKTNLNRLRDVNKHYARLVLSVSNLYNSFLEKLVPTEMQGYDKVASKGASFLEVRA